MAALISELVLLKSLLASFGVLHNQAMQLLCDSQLALYIAKNKVFHEWTKHIEIDCHYVCESFRLGALSLSYVPSKLQPTNIFTKALSKRKFQYL